MTRKKNQKPNPKTWLKSLSSNQKAFIVSVVIIAMGPAYLAISQLVLESKFRSLESDMQEIKSSLDSELGVKSEVKKECYRESFKYQKGPLKCALRLKPEKLVQQEVIIRVKGIIGNNFQEISSNEDFVHYRNKKTGVECELAVSGGSRVDWDKGLTGYDFHCNHNSKRSFYPYIDH